MSGGGEYEPKDSRKVVGTKGDPSKSWREQEDPSEGSGEYEPKDSRNVTRQPASERDRWSGEQVSPPPANADGANPSGRDRARD